MRQFRTIRVNVLNIWNSNMIDHQLLRFSASPSFISNIAVDVFNAARLLLSLQCTLEWAASARWKASFFGFYMFKVGADFIISCTLTHRQLPNCKLVWAFGQQWSEFSKRQFGKRTIYEKTFSGYDRYLKKPSSLSNGGISFSTVFRPIEVRGEETRKKTVRDETHAKDWYIITTNEYKNS